MSHKTLSTSLDDMHNKIVDRMVRGLRSFTPRRIATFFTAALTLCTVIVMAYQFDSVHRTFVGYQSHDRYGNSSRTRRHTGNLFPRRPESEHIDCRRLLNGDEKYAESLKPRSVFVPRPLDMSCKAIKRRIVTRQRMNSTYFGIAFARVAYTDYDFIEAEVRSAYHPENHFCFSLDYKASKKFHEEMKQLQRCLPNVYITKDDYYVDSSGHQMNRALYDCMHIMNNISGWEYFITLQNHDVLTKSPYEMAEILRSFGGANDFGIDLLMDRYDKELDWTVKGIALFRNESLATEAQLNSTLYVAKGPVSASLSKEAVRWLVETVDITTLNGMFDRGLYGVDEFMISSLNVNELLEMPGGFTKQCVERGLETPFITRKVIWSNHGERCGSGLYRHSVCLLGMEDLEIVRKGPQLFINKFWPSFDYGALECARELVFNRTNRGQIDHPLDMEYYRNLPTVLYHKSKTTGSSMPPFDLICPKSSPAQAVILSLIICILFSH